MKCPKCHTSLICVLESRHTSQKAISRRRQCKNCGHVWATAEVTVPDEEWGWMARERSDGTLKAEFGVSGRMIQRLASA